MKRNGRVIIILPWEGDDDDGDAGDGDGDHNDDGDAGDGDGDHNDDGDGDDDPDQNDDDDEKEWQGDYPEQSSVGRRCIHNRDKSSTRTHGQQPRWYSFIFCF